MLKVKIFGDNKPKPGVIAITTVYSSIAKMAEGRIRYSKEINNFADNLEKLVNVWAPSYVTLIMQYADVYRSISQVNYEFAQHEIRVSEDIRDCHERYLCVDRFAKEYNNISEKYESDSQSLINALGSELYEKRVGNYENKKQQLTASIKAAKAQKKATLEKKKNALIEFIKARETYNTFKIRRLRHAFTLYSTSLQEKSEKENELYGKAIEILNQLRNLKDAPQALIDQIAQQSPQPQTEINEAAQAIVDKLENISSSTETQQEENQEQQQQDNKDNDNSPNKQEETDKNDNIQQTDN